MTASTASYFHTLHRMLTEAEQAEAPAIEAAAQLIATALGAGRQVRLLGTGHSYALALELAGRAGGLVGPATIHDGVLSMSEGLDKSTATERLGGYGEILVHEAGIAADDVLIVISNSGRNAVPVEAVLAAKQRGAHTIAVTSVAHSQATQPRPPAPARLCEVADVVLNNHGVPADAAISLPGLANPTGPTSTVLGAAILNAVGIRATELLAAAGREPAVYRSSNA